MQENGTFSVFKQLIIGVIKIFEDDRSLIARELIADDEERNGGAREREQAEKLASKIIARRRIEGAKYAKEERDKSSPDYQLELLAAINEQKNEEIRQLHEEQRILRALASSGLMLAAFAHDLSKLKGTLGSRYDDIKNLFSTKVNVGDFPDDRLLNPFSLLDKAKQDDVKMSQWLHFSTGIIKKDKRRRKPVMLIPYFNKLGDTWSGLFAARGIHFVHTDVAPVSMNAFEIDFDSIFYNLFSNSVEAFVRSKEDRDRQIEVSVATTNRNIVFTYKDNGPGLSADIVNPDDIFKPLFTTKRNASTGEEVGTGLGMWIVKLIAEDNDARVVLLKPQQGFGIQFIFPQRKGA